MAWQEKPPVVAVEFHRRLITESDGRAYVHVTLEDFLSANSKKVEAKLPHIPLRIAEK